VQSTPATIAATIPRALSWSWLLPALAALFLVSGTCALIYQVVWLRLLTHVFGVTTWAASVTLAGFMGGLALGSYGAGRIADRVKSPLVWFGVAECLVGVSAFGSQFALQLAEEIYVRIAPSLPDALGPLTALRFVLTVVVLIVPTTLMGATLPLVVKSSLLRGAGLAERVSILYAVNTAGAILGTLLAGYVLIGGIGIQATFRIAATLNLIVGLAAIAMSRNVTSPALLAGDDETSDEEAPAAEQAVSARFRNAVLVVFAFSGLVSLALEVIWFRVLLLHLQATTYAFTIMLATVLAGIAAGSAAIAPFMRRAWSRPLVLAGLEILIGVSAVLSLLLLGSAQPIIELLGHLTSGFLRGGPERFVAPTVSFLALFPTTFLLGVAFPIGLSLWSAGGNDSSQTGRRIGVFYSLNVSGAILGSMLAGFVLLPAFGSQNSVSILGSLTVGFGQLLLLLQPATKWRWAIAVAGLGALIPSIVLTPDPFDVAVARRYPGDLILWTEEGLQSTVTIQESAVGERRLYLDGMTQAADERLTVTVHRTIGMLPAAIHPDPKQVLVIGLGGGVTAGAASLITGLDVEVVELTDSVVRAAEWFDHVNHNVVHRPNLNIRIDDGRNYMLLTDNRYDVLTADIIRPNTAGAGNLYSREYFELARRVLRDDGFMLQWVGGLPETHQKALVRTFLSVFPDATLWQQSLMIGGKKPLQLRETEFDRKLRDRTTADALALIGIRSFTDLLNQYVAGPEEMRAHVGDGLILTDDRPAVEYFLSLPNDGNGTLDRLRGDVRRHVVP
jgi:spermidine synthase